MNVIVIYHNDDTSTMKDVCACTQKGERSVRTHIDE